MAWLSWRMGKFLEAEKNNVTSAAHPVTGSFLPTKLLVTWLPCKGQGMPFGCLRCGRRAVTLPPKPERPRSCITAERGVEEKKICEHTETAKVCTCVWEREMGEEVRRVCCLQAPEAAGGRASRSRERHHADWQFLQVRRHVMGWRCEWHAVTKKVGMVGRKVLQPHCGRVTAVGMPGSQTTRPLRPHSCRH